MKTAMTILAGLLLSTSLAHTQPGAQRQPSPTFKIVTSTDKAKGQITLLETVTKTVSVREDTVVNIDGREVIKVVTKYVFVYEQRTFVINVADSRVITPDGKQLPIDEVWKRLKKDTAVVVSGDDSTPAQAYLRALNPETLVVIVPRPSSIVAPAAPAVPAPPVKKLNP